MAKIYISEHLYPTQFVQASIPVVKMPALASQAVSFSASPSFSAPFSQVTRLVGVHSDTTCSIEFGEDPEVTTSSKRIAANSTEYFEVTPGHKIAVILNT